MRKTLQFLAAFINRAAVLGSMASAMSWGQPTTHLAPARVRDVVSIVGEQWPDSRVMAVHSNEHEISLLITTNARQSHLVRINGGGQLRSKRQLAQTIAPTWIEVDSNGTLFAPKPRRSIDGLKTDILAFDRTGALLTASGFDGEIVRGFLHDGKIIGLTAQSELLGGPTRMSIFSNSVSRIVHACRIPGGKVILIDGMTGRNAWLDGQSLAPEATAELDAVTFHQARAKIRPEYRARAVMINAAAPAPNGSVFLNLGSAVNGSEGAIVFEVAPGGSVRRTIRCLLPSRPDLRGPGNPAGYFAPSFLAATTSSLALVDSKGYIALYTIPQ